MEPKSESEVLFNSDSYVESGFGVNVTVIHSSMSGMRHMKETCEDKQQIGGQDSGGLSGCGIHFSPWIHQEYTFRHRSACRIPAESGQEYLTSGKEYIEPCKTW